MQNFFTAAKLVIILIIVVAGIVLLAQGEPSGTSQCSWFTILPLKVLAFDELHINNYNSDLFPSSCVQETLRLCQIPLKAQQHRPEQLDLPFIMDFGLMMDGNN